MKSTKRRPKMGPSHLSVRVTKELIEAAQAFSHAYDRLEEEVRIAELEGAQMTGVTLLTSPGCSSDRVLAILNKVACSSQGWVEMCCNDLLKRAVGFDLPHRELIHFEEQLALHARGPGLKAVGAGWQDVQKLQRKFSDGLYKVYELARDLPRSSFKITKRFAKLDEDLVEILKLQAQVRKAAQESVAIDPARKSLAHRIPLRPAFVGQNSSSECSCHVFLGGGLISFGVFLSKLEPLGSSKEFSGAYRIIAKLWLSAFHNSQYFGSEFCDVDTNTDLTGLLRETRDKLEAVLRLALSEVAVEGDLAAVALSQPKASEIPHARMSLAVDGCDEFNSRNGTAIPETRAIVSRAPHETDVSKATGKNPLSPSPQDDRPSVESFALRVVLKISKDCDVSVSVDGGKENPPADPSPFLRVALVYLEAGRPDIFVISKGGYQEFANKWQKDFGMLRRAKIENKEHRERRERGDKGGRLKVRTFDRLTLKVKADARAIRECLGIWLPKTPAISGNLSKS